MTETNDNLPTTIDAAVRLLLAMVPEDEQAKIAAMPEHELIMLHFGLGQATRVEELRVIWPNRHTSILSHPAIDEYHQISAHQ